MKTKKMIQKQCISYLKTKYDTEFSYVSDGYNDGWPSHWKNYIYTDYKGREFSIEIGDKSIHDNYCSSLFDPVLQDTIQRELGSNYHVFVSSQDSFFGNDRKFDDYSDYVKECPYIRIFILINQSMDMSSSLQHIKKIGALTKYYVNVYKTTTEIESSVADYHSAQRIPTKDIIEFESITLDVPE